MKTYVDFISDMIDDKGLFDKLNQVIPFDSENNLEQWFAEHGYHIDGNEVSALFHQQRAMVESCDQVEY